MTSVKNARKATAAHRTGRQRGEGNLPVGNSRIGNTTRRDHPTPLAHPPNHPIQPPAGSAPGSVNRAYTAYSSASSAEAMTRAPERKSQPIGFSGRREAIRAPTEENARIKTATSDETHAEDDSLTEARATMGPTASATSVHGPHAVHLAVPPIMAASPRRPPRRA